MTDEDAIVVHQIGAHALKRRRVDVKSDRWVRADVAYAVNVRWREVKEVAYRADADRLVVRIAGRGDRELIADLAARAELPEPEGALLVGVLDGRPLAAVSLTNGAALRESTSNGLAAVAAVRYALAGLQRRARKPRTSAVRPQLREAA
jgi:hypothetical protein